MAKKKVKIGWDNQLKIYRQLLKNEITVGVTIVKLTEL